MENKNVKIKSKCDIHNVITRTFTLEDMKKAFKAGLNRGVDVTLIIETNGKHNAISGFPNQNEWLTSEYGC